jgi:uncharacterized membrane protein (DUF4010 family)
MLALTKAFFNVNLLRAGVNNSLEEFVAFPHSDISAKIILALGVGLLVGLEREFASKDVGVRTFSLTSLFGLMSSLLGASFTVAGLACVLFITVYMNVRAMLVNRTLEITTSVAMFITFCIGVLVGQGHVFTPVAVSILMTLLLAWKSELAAFAHGLRLDEIRSAVMIGLLTFVIYPVLPDHFIDPWDLLNPKQAWLTIIVLAGISFVNYVLLKAYSTKGLYYSALLGGAVNSSAAVSEISGAVKTPAGRIIPHALAILLMITIAMFIRNLVLLGIFEPPAIGMALVPLVVMASTAAFFVWRARQRKEDGTIPISPLKVGSPVALKRIIKFGLLFILLQAAGTLAQRYLGSAGVLSVSFLGGLVSSASATAAAAKLAAQGKITPTIAAVATVLASISSAFVNLPIVRQITKDKELTKNLGMTTFICILAGLAMMALVAWVESLLGFQA